VLKIKLGNIVVMSLQNEFTQTPYEWWPFKVQIQKCTSSFHFQRKFLGKVISTNPPDPEINNHVSLQWSWRYSNSWPLKSKFKTYPIEITLKILYEYFYYTILRINLFQDPYVPHLSSSLEALNPILVRSLCKIKEVNLKREIEKHPFKHENFTSFHRCSVLTRINAGFQHNNHYQTDENQCRRMLSKIVS
jgi:hypothetical protein